MAKERTVRRSEGSKSEPRRTPTEPPVENVIAAPLIFFDGACGYGIGPGIGRVVLDALVQEPTSTGGIVMRRVATLHLRGSLSAFASLRTAIDGMERMLEPAKDPTEIN